MDIETACGKFIDHCQSSKNLSSHTLRAYKVDLKDFGSFCGATKALNLCDKAIIRSYLGHLQEERQLKSTTVKRRLACLKVMFRWLEDEELIDTDPLYRLNARIVLPKRLPKTLSRNEIGTLLIHCRNMAGWPACKDRKEKFAGKENLNNFTSLVAVEILFATGIRVGELVSISINDIDLSTGTIIINGKGNRQRLVFITDSEILEMLEAYQERKTGTLIKTKAFLINTRGNRTSTALIRKLITQAAEKAKIQRRTTPHMLRHTAASHLLRAGVDIRYVQQLLGHHSISTTQIYTHVSDSQLKNIISSLHPRRDILEGMISISD